MTNNIEPTWTMQEGILVQQNMFLGSVFLSIFSSI